MAPDAERRARRAGRSGRRRCVLGQANPNVCDTTFQTDFQALKSAGIVVVFAAGNSGPSPSTSVGPANNVDGYSAGAVDSADTIAYFSSRGPSACDARIFPDVVAPGVNIKTSDISLAGVPQYSYVSGTSFSAPHVAGAAALLAEAFPTATVADIERALRVTSRDLGLVGPDNDFGYGVVDAYAAYLDLVGEILPAPWLHQDIGLVGQAGSASYVSGTFSVKGSGAGITGTSDQFHFVYQALTGDGEIKAKVLSVQNTAVSSTAGVMIRESLAANAAEAMMSLRNDGRGFFRRRLSTGGTTSTIGDHAGDSVLGAVWCAAGACLRVIGRATGRRGRLLALR